MVGAFTLLLNLMKLKGRRPHEPKNTIRVATTGTGEKRAGEDRASWVRRCLALGRRKAQANIS